MDIKFKESLAYLEQQIINGLSTGSIYVLIAVGYTLIFGIFQVIFFAQGELSMIAAFAGLLVYQRFSYIGWGIFPVMLCLGVAVSVGTGLLAERIALRPLSNSPKIKALISTLGVSIILQNIVMASLGPQNYPFPPNPLEGSLHIFGIWIGYIHIVIFLVMLSILSILELFLRQNRYGLAIKAVAQNRRGAQLMGIDVNRTIVITFVISSFTAAIAGICMGFSYGSARFDMGFLPGIKGFTAAILGGIGNIRGAILAGLLIGVCEALFSGYVSTDYKDFLVFLLLLLILLVRPKGLMGGKS